MEVTNTMGGRARAQVPGESCGIRTAWRDGEDGSRAAHGRRRRPALWGRLRRAVREQSQQPQRAPFEALGHPGGDDRPRHPQAPQGQLPAILLEPRRRAEQALVSVVCQAYVEGVSTRRVDDLVRAMGIDGMSKSQVSELAKNLDARVAEFRNRPLDAGPYTYVWLDALFHKVREGGRVVSVATVIATGVNAEGHREILGVDVFTTRTGPAGRRSSADSSPRALRRRPRHLRRPRRAEERHRGGAPRSFVAALSDPRHAQPVDPGPQGGPGHGGDPGAHGLRPVR